MTDRCRNRRHATPRPCCARRHGTVLIVVLIVVVMIGLAGLGFVSMMSTEHKAIHVQGDELLLRTMAGSGEELLGAFLQQSAEDREAGGGAYDNPGLFRGQIVFEDSQSQRRGRVSIVAPLLRNDQIVGMRFGAANESARLNLATVLRWDYERPGAGREALMSLPGMSESTADAILDWIDADMERRQFGAEEDYYAGLNLPYGPRNSVPASLEELLLVRGVTRDLMFGGDADFNHHVDLAETVDAQSRAGAYRPGSQLTWASLITVHSAQRNRTPRGTARIDLNDSDLGRLYGRLAEVFDERRARFIVLYRQYGPFDEPFPPPGVSQERPRQNVDPQLLDRYELDLRIRGDYRLASVLDLIDARVQLPVAADRAPAQPRDEDVPEDEPAYEIVAGPFLHDLQAMQEYLPSLLDETTVDAADVIYGRVNLNQAPLAVLRAVPELDASTAERILSRRDTPGATRDPNRRYPTWLLTEGLVDLPTMKRLMPDLTCGGDVFRAQIVSYFDAEESAARAELVLDATGTPPRRVYWKDLRLLGRGYPLPALGAVAN